MSKVMFLLTFAGAMLLALTPAAFPMWEQTSSPDSNTWEVHYSSPYLFAGTSHGAFRSSDQGDTWTSIGLHQFRINVFEVHNSNLYAGTMDSGVFVSDNFGDSWTAIGPTHPLGVDIYSFGFSGPDIFVGTDIGWLYKTTDGGANWSAQTIAYVGHMPSILIDGMNIKVATWWGLQSSTDYGATWLPLHQTAGGQMEDLIPFNGALLAAQGSGIRRSPDGNATWDWAFECAAVQSLATAGAIVIAGSSGGSGIVLSTDGGQVWTTFNKGMQSYEVFSVATSDQYIFAGVVNRSNLNLPKGVWRRPLADLNEFTLCGDVDLSGTNDLADLIMVINHIFMAGSLSAPLNVVDVDCSGFVSISDVVKLAHHLFRSYYFDCRACSP